MLITIKGPSQVPCPRARSACLSPSMDLHRCPALAQEVHAYHHQWTFTGALPSRKKCMLITINGPSQVPCPRARSACLSPSMDLLATAKQSRDDTTCGDDVAS